MDARQHHNKSVAAHCWQAGYVRFWQTFPSAAPTPIYVDLKANWGSA
jgi:hypothetical protein